MCGVGLPLYKQLSKGIISILATQHPNDIPLVDRWKLEHFRHLPWMVCGVQWAPTINIDIDTTLNSSMDACVRLIHHYTGKQTRGSHPYWSYIPKNVPWVDGWKLGHFHPLPWMVYDVPWAPTIHTCVDTPVNPSMSAWVRLIHHCISNQARGSHPYWPHNTQRMDEHGGKKTGTFSAFAFDGVWCTMSSNHMYRFWHPYQSINGYMNKVDTPLHKQPSKRITSILATQHPNDIPWVDRWKLGHFLLLPWMVHDVQPMSSNHSYRYWHPYQSICGCMDEVSFPLYKKPSNEITYILATQHPNDIPWVDGWKLGYFHPLPWMVCDIPWAPTIHTGVDTPINPSMDAWVRLIHHYTSNQARG